MGARYICLIVMLSGVFAAPTAALAQQTPANTQDVVSARKAQADLSKVEAETAKLKAETRKLRGDQTWWGRLLPLFAPFLTVLVAGGTLLVSVWKVGRDRRDALDKEVREREETRRSAEVERFDERFAKAAAGLASTNAGEESGAAVLVAGMVKEKREELSDEALLLLVGSLQLPHGKGCERLLRYALERFARAAPARLLTTGDGQSGVGLSHVQASYLNLAGLDLPGLDIAFAQLRKANFRDARLRGCLGYKAMLDEAIFERSDLREAQWVKGQAVGANFRYANLAGARLRLAKLGKANFFKADLTGADLYRAEVAGARFERSLLAGANFREAVFDDKALKSILRAKHWRSANFDPDVRARLEQLTQ